MRILIVIALLLAAGCSKDTKQNKPAKTEKKKTATTQSKNNNKDIKTRKSSSTDKTEKSTASQVIEYATGKTSVDKYKKAKDQIEEMNKKQQERLDMIKEY